MTLDADGRVRAANPAARALFGAAADVQAGSIDMLLSSAGRVLFHNYLVPLLHLHGSINEFALEFVPAGGRPFDALVYAGLRPGAGDTTRCDLMLAPLRERRRLEDELRRIKAAADAAPGVVFELLRAADGRCMLTYASEALGRLYGLRPESGGIALERLLECVLPEDRAALTAALFAIDDGRHWQHSFRVLTPDGLATHEVQARSQRLPDGSIRCNGSLSDVSERYAIEQVRRDCEVAQQASRAKSEFLSRLSHELRTPLNAIIGFGSLLANDPTSPLDPRQRQRVQQIESASQALLALVDEVLDITRIESGALDLPLRAVAVAPLLQRVLQTAAAEADKAGLALCGHAAPELTVLADPGRLHQVLINLVSNAIKFNRPGGEVTIEVRSCGATVEIAVSDTGIGISEARLRDMFQPFNRLGAERLRIDGVGLGLVIARRFAEAMHGSLSVESRVGIGSCFRLRLRATQAQASPRAA